MTDIENLGNTPKAETTDTDNGGMNESMKNRRNFFKLLVALASYTTGRYFGQKEGIEYQEQVPEPFQNFLILKHVNSTKPMILYLFTPPNQ